MEQILNIFGTVHRMSDYRNGNVGGFFPCKSVFPEGGKTLDKGQTFNRNFSGISQ